MKYFLAILRFMLMVPKSPAMRLLRDGKVLLGKILESHPPDCLFVEPLQEELEKYFDFLYGVDCTNDPQAEQFRYELIRFAWQVSKYAMRRRLSDIRQEKLIIHMVHVVHQGEAVALFKRLVNCVHMDLAKIMIQPCFLQGAIKIDRVTSFQSGIATVTSHEIPNLPTKKNI